MTRAFRPHDRRTLILRDEPGAPGKIESFVTARTLLRPARVQLCSFWQDHSQLITNGNDARTLIDNAGVLQCPSARNLRTAKRQCL
jgi:type IV secretory pathway TraG/TraD family ATPase VirD4